MRTRNILEYLENSAALFPTKTAVLDEHGNCSYQELLENCQRIGSSLAGKIPQGAPVAVLMEKGIPALNAFWGIVYAGGFYVFFNPELPLSRLEQIQKVLQAGLVICDAPHRDIAASLFAPEQILLVDDLLSSPINPEALQQVRSRMIDTDPLYANFTSGSTGVPKGVVVSHRSVIDFIEVFTELFEITETDIVANQAPFDFDVSVKDLYSALKTGATLVTVPRALFSRPTELLDFLCDHHVTTMIWAVSALCLISTFHGLDYRVPDTVEKVLFSGEVMPSKHLESWRSHLPNARFVNLYGPTEITCNCTYHILDPQRSYADGIPIGRAFPNEQVFLLAEDGGKSPSPEPLGKSVCGEPLWRLDTTVPRSKLPLHSYKTRSIPVIPNGFIEPAIWDAMPKTGSCSFAGARISKSSTWDIGLSWKKSNARLRICPALNDAAVCLTKRSKNSWDFISAPGRKKSFIRS